MTTITPEAPLKAGEHEDDSKAYLDMLHRQNIYLPEAGEHVDADPAGFLSPDNLTALRLEQNRRIAEAQYGLWPDTEAMREARDRVFVDFDELRAEYLREGFGIQEDDPDFDVYLNYVRAFSVDNMSNDKWWAGEIDYNHDEEDEEPDLITGREWAQRLHDGLAEEFEGQEPAPADNTKTAELPKVQEKKEKEVKKRHGAKVGDRVSFSYQTPDGSAVIDYQVLGFPKQTEDQENPPVLMRRIEARYDKDGNNVGHEVISESVYSSDQIKHLGRDVKLYNSRKNRQKPIDLQQYWNEIVPTQERKEGRRKKIKRIAGGVAIFAAGATGAGVTLLAARYGNDLSGFVESARDFLAETTRDVFGPGGEVLAHDTGKADGVESIVPESAADASGIQESVQSAEHPSTVVAEHGDSLWHIAADMVKDAGLEASNANIDKVKDALVATNDTYTEGNVTNGINEGQKVHLKGGWRVIEQMR